MKKHKILFLFLVPVILILLIILFVFVQNRTVSENILNVPDMIYVPSGTADEYNNLYSGFTDGHIIWEYELNSNEKEKAEQDLNNEIWTKITEEAKSEIIYYFTFNSETYLPDTLSDDLYFCIYDFGLKRFIGATEDVALFGWHRAIFVFDKENARYYCADLSI